jgi:hypothetical protein
MTLFTENPLWAYVILGVLGVIFLCTFFVNKRVLYLALVPLMLVLGLGFWLIDYAIETDREQVERKTTELARAVELGDMAKLDDLISKKFYHPAFANKETLLAQARVVLQPNQERTAKLWQFETKAGTSGKSMILTGNASANGQYGSINVPGFIGKVEMTYLKDDDGQWRLVKFYVTDSQGNEVNVRR